MKDDQQQQQAKQILEYLRNLHSITDILTWIAGRFDRAVDQVEKQPAIDDVLREMSDYLTSSIDRIDRLLLLILERLPDRNISARARRDTAELRREAITNRIRSLNIQLEKHQDNLNYLEEQAAQYGSNVPIEIQNQITWTNEKLSEIRDYIDELSRDDA